MADVLDAPVGEPCRIKAEKTSSATVSFQKSLRHVVFRVLFVCQMVFITIWRIFLFLFCFGGRGPPFSARAPPSFEVYSMKLKIQEVYDGKEKYCR